MDKSECEDIYSETETEEHLNGKRDLYEWIKKQKDVTNAILEGWIPETKQRPDIIFEYNEKKYVIEYQCSPIATEYIERHELYKTIGMQDIWICGTEKYLQKNMRNKYLEKFSSGYYNFHNQMFIFPLNSDVHALLNNFAFKFGFEYNYYKPTHKKMGTGLYSLKLNRLSFNGKIISNTLPDKDSVYKKREIRRQYKEWHNNKWKRFIYFKLDKLCKTLSNETFQYSYSLQYDYIILECSIRYKSYCYSANLKFYPYYNNAYNLFKILDIFINKNKDRRLLLSERISSFDVKYHKLFYELRYEKLTLIKKSDKKKAAWNNIKYKTIKECSSVNNWYLEDYTTNKDSIYFSCFENEFIFNLYTALKFLKIYNFDYRLLLPLENIGGDSGVYDLGKDEDIRIYFTKILGFENIEIYKG